MAGGSFAAGRRRLRRKLTRNMPQNVLQAANAATKIGAEQIVSLQKRLAPVDDGDLQMSITYTPPGQSTPPYSQPGGQQRARAGQFIITAGNTDVRYPHLVEYGTAPHINGGKFAGTEHPGTKAQPFFWPSYRALKTVVKSRITRAIRKAIKDGAK